MSDKNYHLLKPSYAPSEHRELWGSRFNQAKNTNKNKKQYSVVLLTKYQGYVHRGGYGVFFTTRL
jgi:hypothetical protein